MAEEERNTEIDRDSIILLSLSTTKCAIEKSAGYEKFVMWHVEDVICLVLFVLGISELRGMRNE